MDTVSAIRQIRSFNRTVAEGIGALGPQFLGRTRPMGESRLLWEIGENGVAVRALRQRLGLDSGYVSRTLRSLERQGLVRVKADPGDGRVRRASLTKAGLRERAVLDRRSDQVARQMMEPLNDEQRTTLLEYPACLRPATSRVSATRSRRNQGIQSPYRHWCRIDSRRGLVHQCGLAATGGQFLYNQMFNISGGTSSDLQSVSNILR
jgi:DNA-binding MarR family transcriptional regulator